MKRGATLVIALLVVASSVTMVAAAGATTSQVESETATDSDAETSTATDADSDDGLDSNTSTETETSAETDIEAESDGELDSSAEVDSETSVESESETSTAADGESNATAESDAAASAQVNVDVRGSALADYRVDGDQLFATVAVQSQDEAESGGEGDAVLGLEAATELTGADMSVSSETESSIEVRTESGATVSAHDDRHGTLVVESEGEPQYVRAELGADAETREEGDRIVVETENREGVFLVVGDGDVAVSEGNVTAQLSENATLAFRSYEDGERDERDEYEESLIVNGTAAVEATADHRDGETVTSAVTYGQETSANATQRAENRVDVTVDRATHNGTVIVTTVSEEAVGSLEDLSVTIDGEAAAEVDSRSEVEGAIGSDETRYMVVQDAESSSQATVYIGVNHFSKRTASIQGGDGGTSSETDTDERTESETATDDDADDSMPGFGAGVAALAISLAGLVARFRT